MVAKPINPRLAAALDYLARGWSAIPLCPPDYFGLLPPTHCEQCKRPGKAPPWSWEPYQQRLATEKELRFS